MANLWQLKKLSTGEALNDPQPLPENWGPIFGLLGMKDKLNDLSWLGNDYVDIGWIETAEEYNPGIAEQLSKEQQELDKARQMLRDSDWSMLPDVPMSKEEKAKWIEYRKLLRDIKLQPEFPDNIHWPIQPE